MTITIDEAIEVLEKERNDHHSYATDIIGQAEALGIEALREVKSARERGYISKVLRLPGETE